MSIDVSTKETDITIPTEFDTEYSIALRYGTKLEVPIELLIITSKDSSVRSLTYKDIDKISITSKGISVVGSTSSQKKTLTLFEAIKKNGLNILSTNTATKAGRGNFSIMVEPEKSS